MQQFIKPVMDQCQGNILDLSDRVSTCKVVYVDVMSQLSVGLVVDVYHLTENDVTPGHMVITENVNPLPHQLWAHSPLFPALDPDYRGLLTCDNTIQGDITFNNNSNTSHIAWVMTSKCYRAVCFTEGLIIADWEGALLKQSTKREYFNQKYIQTKSTNQQGGSAIQRFWSKQPNHDLDKYIFSFL